MKEYKFEAGRTYLNLHGWLHVIQQKPNGRLKIEWRLFRYWGGVKTVKPEQIGSVQVVTIRFDNECFLFVSDKVTPKSTED